MNKNTLGGEAFDGGEPVDPFTPLVRGLEFIEDHRRFWLADDHEFVTPEALAALRKTADQLVILDLSEHTDVDPELKASIDPYPPMRSEMPLLSLGEVLDLIHVAYGQPDNPNPA